MKDQNPQFKGMKIDGYYLGGGIVISICFFLCFEHLLYFGNPNSIYEFIVILLGGVLDLIYFGLAFKEVREE